MKPNGISLSHSQRTAWLRLIRSDNVGPATFRELINHCGSAEKALDMLPELAKRGGAMKRVRVASADEADREMQIAARNGGRFVAIGESDYPPALRSIDGAPPLLAMCGSGETATRPTLAIVGARNASVAGAKFAAMIAAEAASAGYTIASGLARGIDAAAHQASLKHGTLASLAGGLDRIYPSENTELYHRICGDGGVAISEMPYGWEPRARDFPRRNRLIAGCALAVVVVEAAMRSGSLITARLANESGRLVLAVPGSPLDPRAQGCNSLIKQGAMIACSPDDVLEALAPLAGMALPISGDVKEEKQPETGPTAEPQDNERIRIAQALGPSPCEIDDLIRYTGIDAANVQLVLLELDLAGRLVRHPGGRISLS